MRRIGTSTLERWGAVGLMAVSLACSSSTAPDVSAPAPGVEPATEVAVASVRRGTIETVITAPATLEARRESRIGPEVQGTLLHVFVDEGDRVEAGDALFEIDPDPYRFAQRQAEAGLALAAAQRQQIDADLERARALQSEAIVAAQAIERLETQRAVARASERQAAEALALARHRLEQTLVRAPYGGSIAVRLADEGTTALVQPQTIVLVLQENTELEARAAIPESQLFGVRVGDPAEIRVEGLTSPIETTVSSVGDAIDLATRTYSVRMLVPNEDRRLKAGVFGQVEIRPRPLADVVVVPRDAIRSEEGGSRVFTLENGVVTAVPVTLGVISDELVELRTGPRVGTAVIVGSDAAHVTPGMGARARAEPEA